MLPDVVNIKNIRKSLGMTQKELALLAGVSQSIIAKIESERVSPSYEIVKKIFDVFENLENKNIIKAVDIVNKKIIFVDKNDRVSIAIEKMKKHGYSQIPVFYRGQSVGSISEKGIVDIISSGKSLERINDMKVSEVMEESFPRINENTPTQIVSMLLQHSSAVLVTKQDKTIGIITKSDLLKTIGKK
jgi:predicted transcriptional regulator